MKTIHNDSMLLTCLFNAEAVMHQFQIMLLCKHKDIGARYVLIPIIFTQMKDARNTSMPMNARNSVFLTTEISSISRMPLALKGNKIWHLCHSLWVNATEVNCQNIKQSSNMSPSRSPKTMGSF